MRGSLQDRKSEGMDDSPISSRRTLKKKGIFFPTFPGCRSGRSGWCRGTGSGRSADSLPRASSYPSHTSWGLRVESSWGVDFGRSGSYLLDEVAADFQHPPPPTGPPGTLAHTPVALANSGWPNKRRGTRTNRLWPHLASRSSDGRIPAFRVVRAQFVDVDGAF